MTDFVISLGKITKIKIFLLKPLSFGSHDYSFAHAMRNC